MSLLDNAKQSAIVQELASDPRACVVYQQEVAEFWASGADIQAKPVVRFIRENFHKVIEGSGYSLLMRNPPTG
jgi:archaeosine-15-forming tRNA-guanine transglycosylase